MSMPRVIISGGGTGGHVFPAIAIADAIKAKAPNTDILFVGANGKIEMERVPKAGYAIEGLDVVGFQRKLTVKNLAFPFKLMSSMWKALRIVRKYKPDVAIGVGGYASGPVLKIANSLGITTVLQEQNSYAGVTNKLLANKASLICVAYDGMERFFPKDKIVFTGNPIRKGLLDQKMDRVEARKRLGFDGSKKTILVFGGSLGAKTINEAMAAHAATLEARSDINVYWQVGKIYYDQYRDHTLGQCSHIKIVPFIEDMDVAYSAADLVVCRAGALTISELSALHKAAILLPSPNVAEDHQTVNANALVQRDAAVMIKDVDAANAMVTEMMTLVANEARIKQLEQNVAYFGRTNAAEVIADNVLALIYKKSQS
jgi:UDP-N-acetylglucosamine--N-acetylmuramyl-(pentapeptide) pyrophosphoryl-undecaprenol N-acetylglucosamine transferase